MYLLACRQTVATTLGVAASSIWPAAGPLLRVIALAYGLPTWGFGVYWLALTLLITLRAARIHLPFTLGWWAFTFPVDVLTTATYVLYSRTQAPLFAFAGVVFLLLLALLWMLVAVHSVRQCVLAVRNARTVSISPADLEGAATASVAFGDLDEGPEVRML